MRNEKREAQCPKLELSGVPPRASREDSRYCFQARLPTGNGVDKWEFSTHEMSNEK